MEFDHGKLFVGGISQETSEEILKEHFSKYGEVIDSEIIRDRSTGKTRGFGFVTLADVSVVDKALQDEHIILARKVEVKLAKPKDEQSQNQHYQCFQCFQQQNSRSSNNCNILSSTKKIFVGGLPPSLTEEELKKYFERFGVITDVVVICDKENNRSRGFGFITFDCEKAVDDVLQINYHKLNYKLVEVKRAESKDRDRHIYTYDCYKTGLGIERLFVSGDCGFHLPYVPFCTTCSACMSYLGYYYGAVFPTRPCNGVVSDMASYYGNPLSYGNPFFYPTFMNGVGYTTGLGSKLVGMTHGNGSYHGSATFIVNNNSTENGANNEVQAASEPLGVTDGNGSYSTFIVNSNSTKNGGDAKVPTTSGPVGVTDSNGSYHGNATFIANSNSTENGGDAEVPSRVIIEVPARVIDAALFYECSDTEHQKEVDCQSTPCKSN